MTRAAAREDRLDLAALEARARRAPRRSPSSERLVEGRHGRQGLVAHDARRSPRPAARARVGAATSATGSNACSTTSCLRARASRRRSRARRSRQVVRGENHDLGIRGERRRRRRCDRMRARGWGQRTVAPCHAPGDARGHRGRERRPVTLSAPSGRGGLSPTGAKGETMRSSPAPTIPRAGARARRGNGASGHGGRRVRAVHEPAVVPRGGGARHRSRAAPLRPVAPCTH